MAVTLDPYTSSLEGYLPSEVRALMEHKYFLGIERGYDPPIEEVIVSWETRFARDWRARKMRRDAEAQVREIDAYRERLIAERGTSVTFREAAHAWVDECECQWRESWEASTASGF
jgi:hypothetical protein